MENAAKTSLPFKMAAKICVVNFQIWKTKVDCWI